MSQAQAKRHRLQLAAAAAVYTVAIYWARALVENAIPGNGQMIFALIPLVPALFMVYYALETVRSSDELQRRVHLEGLAFGFVGAGISVVTVALLQTAGFPDLGWMWVWVVMTAFWVTGLLLAYRRYR